MCPTLSGRFSFLVVSNCVERFVCLLLLADQVACGRSDYFVDELGRRRVQRALAAVQRLGGQ